MKDLLFEYSTLLIWLWTILSTFISVREYVLTRRRIRHLDKSMKKMANNQLLMFKELMKLKGERIPEQKSDHKGGQ